MKSIKTLFGRTPLAKMFGTYAAATATVAVIALAASGLVRPARAVAGVSPRNNTQVAELYELQAAFHAAASHGGDIDAMMQLWAEDSSITVGGVLYSGKDGVRDFFANHSGAFKNNWVSLAPSFKTHFEIRGNTAGMYFECHYADPSVTPYTIRADVSAIGTAKKVNGAWVFWNLVAGSAPL